VARGRLAQILIGVTALATVAGMFWLGRGNALSLAVNLPVGIAVLVAAAVGIAALAGGDLPESLGVAPAATGRRALLGLSPVSVVYLGTALAVPLFAVLVQFNAAAGGLLAVFGGAAFLKLLADSWRAEKGERERLWVVLVLMFFSMLFWAFFEQAGSSLNNFADRNVDRTVLGAEVPASIFQAANPIFILAFGLVFSATWGFLGRRGLDPSAPVKFALGLVQLGLGFGAIWLGASRAASDGLVSPAWLLLAYLLHTTGELCLSPVGLSMVTKLAPARMVSTVMGAWFLATAFSNYLAGLIASLTGAGHGTAGGTLPPPAETVALYGSVFGSIAVTSLASAAVLLVLSPLLSRWARS
jgi:POT family proton-dependent oligopeptide transporter